MTSRVCATIAGAALSLIACSRTARAEYQLHAYAEVVTNGDIVPGDHPIQDLTNSDASADAAVSSSLDIICWRDTGLQVHCERGTSPSGTSIETVNSGN